MNRIYLFLFSMLWACGIASTGEPPATSPFEENLLSLVGFDGSVLNPQKRFTGYARSSRRVTVIDPTTRKEIWGRTVDQSYAAAFPLHDYSSVALINKDRDELVVLTAKRAFPFSLADFSRGFFSRASDDFAFAAWSDTSQQLKTVRFAGGGWQEQVFASPVFGEASIAEGNDGMVGLFKADGSRYVALHPATGSYFVLKAGDDGRYGEPELVCPRNDDFEYRAMAYDAASDYLLVGSGDGTLVAFSTEICAAESPPQITLHNGFPITDATMTDTSLVAVTQAGGWFHLFRFDGEKFYEEFSLANTCPYPRGALNVDDELSLVVCYDPDNFDPTLEAKEAPSVVQYKEAYLVTVDRGQAQVTHRLEINPQTTAGMAVDADNRDLVLLMDSSLGRLVVIDLETKERNVINGVFLADILNP